MAIKNKKVIFGGVVLALTINVIGYSMSKMIYEKKELENTIIKLEQSVEKADKKVKDLNNQIKEKDKQIKVLNKELKVALDKYKEVNNKNKKLKEENKELKKTKSTNVNYKISQSEIDLLERLVFCEAGAESEKGQIAVVNVIFNRLNDDEFPDTITDIIYQKNQFSPVSNGAINNVKPDKQVKESVQKALNGKKVISDDSVYFFATWVRSSHPIRSHVKILETIGVHHFGKWM